jgi:hypothetical protein
VISDGGGVSVGGGLEAHLVYDRDQLLQAQNEYNKASLSAAALEEHRQVPDYGLLEKPTKHPSRESRNMWTDLRTT